MLKHHEKSDIIMDIKPYAYVLLLQNNQNFIGENCYGYCNLNERKKLRIFTTCK